MKNQNSKQDSIEYSNVDLINGKISLSIPMREVIVWKPKQEFLRLIKKKTGICFCFATVMATTFLTRPLTRIFKLLVCQTVG